MKIDANNMQANIKSKFENLKTIINYKYPVERRKAHQEKERL